jgi:hypothetical protein
VLNNKDIYDKKKAGMDYKDEIQQIKNKKHLMRLKEEDVSMFVVMVYRLMMQ